MVQADGGDGAHLRLDDVGGVVGSPQPHLQYLESHPFLLKEDERQSREQLEGGQLTVARLPVYGFHLRLQPVHYGDQLGLGYHLPVHPAALAEGGQVGGGIQAGSVARFAQGRSHHGGGAALALGAADVDGLRPQVGVAQPVQQQMHPPQVVEGGVVGHGYLLVVRVAVYVVQSLLIVHLPAMIPEPAAVGQGLTPPVTADNLIREG